MAEPSGTTPFRLSRGALAFGALLIALVAAYLFIAFAYGHGIWDVLGAIIGGALVLAMLAALYLLAAWWTRTGPFGRHGTP